MCAKPESRRIAVVLTLVFAAWSMAAVDDATTQPVDSTNAATLEDAKYACPMERHPDESDPAKQGAYFSMQPGKCPWCGMKLKPVSELAWVAARRAAAGGEVAYTCPRHQHVFSRAAGECPRCGEDLAPFKVMYTCPDPKHAAVVRTAPGACPHDHRRLVPFRGIWLSEEMAARNMPPSPEVAKGASYRCSLHPLVHSDRPGDCTICGRPLSAAIGAADDGESAAKKHALPEDAKYVCPMEECHVFSAEPGECPKCGMQLKPIADVEWAAALKTTDQPAARPNEYVCPMHADQVRTEAPGMCPVCGMRLVRAEALERPTSAPAAIAAQVDYLMEHYLALQQRFAADRTDDVALHALGLVGAADELLKHAAERHEGVPAGIEADARALRASALKLTGKNLDDDRVTFAAISDAMAALVERVRPDKAKYPTIYHFHCPMAHGDWLQLSDEPANPYYGFKMLNCGKLKAAR